VIHDFLTAPVSLETLQVNITKLCNQSCVHCHVDAGPRRKEAMSDEVLAQCLEILKNNEGIRNLDITGGAPELHPRFRDLVAGARALGRHVMVRHNLTVTLDPHPQTKESLQDLPDFFREQRVEVISSLPYYQEYFTDRQRGSGVFKKSMASLRLLNERGFGVEGTGLLLNLVYNPVGAFLPAAQEALEKDYKRELKDKFGIVFSRLYALTNMPIHRFKAQLKRQGGYEAYMDKLRQAYNPQAAAGAMCRTLLSVSWDGQLYDCDFNLMLGMPGEGGGPVFGVDAARVG
jgi:radical SAM/Cys-rich protein